MWTARCGRKAGANGFLCASMPEQYGGAGADRLYSIILMEEQARANSSSLGFGLHSEIVAPYLLRYGNDHIKSTYLPKMAAGEWIGAIAMSEPGAGSDLQAIKTTAVKKGDKYIVNGSKTFITNGWHCDLVIVVAKTDPAKGAKGTSLIVVDTSMKGFAKGKRLKKMGLKGQDTSELFFDNVEVPDENLLGQENNGFIYLMQELPWERMQIAIGAIAKAEAAIGWTIDYVRERKAFGKTVATFQNTRFKLAELATEAQVARVFVDKCIELLMAGHARRRHRLDVQVLVLRHRVQDHRRVPAAARRLRLHVGIPHRPRLRRRPRTAHLRRHQRNYERSHQPLAGTGRKIGSDPIFSPQFLGFPTGLSDGMIERLNRAGIDQCRSLSSRFTVKR